MRRVAITGGRGFIGARLVEAHLALGDEVRVLTRRPPREPSARARFFEGDLEKEGPSLSSFLEGADLLYHCAGQLSDPARMWAAHVEGTRRLLRQVAGTRTRWVQLSSVGVYGRQREGTVREDTPPSPLGPYEESKAEADRLVLEARAHGVLGAAVVLRPSIVFGRGMPNSALRGLAAMLRRRAFFYVGAPGASANYVAVENVVDALLLAGAASIDGVYNLSEHTTIEAFVEAIARAIGAPSPLLRLPEAPIRRAARLASRLPISLPLTESRVDALTVRARYSTAAISRDLGYRPRLSIEEGVALMFAAEST